MKNKNIGIIIVVAVIVLIGGLFYFFYHSSNPVNSQSGRFGNGRGMRNFTLSQEQINNVTTFFGSNPSIIDINSYCSNNRMNCFYYCRIIDSNNDYCKTMMTMNRSGNFSYQRRNNSNGA